MATQEVTSVIPKGYENTNGKKMPGNKQLSYSAETSASSRQLNVQKTAVLREITSKVIASCKRDLGSADAEVFENATDVDVLFDFVAGERLRCMPHSGSRYDKVLRWAELFAAQVSDFSESVSEAVMYSAEAARIIWGSCLVLLQLGESHLMLLDKLFGIFYKFGLSLEIFQNAGFLLQTPAGQKHCGKAFASLLQVVANSSIYYVKKSGTRTIQVKNGEFEELFGRVAESFYHETASASTEMWAESVSELPSSDKPFDVYTLRRFLAPQDRVTQALLSGRIASRHHRAEYSCEWATGRLTDFARSKDDVLLVTGQHYSGKSVLAGWIVDRMRSTKGRLSHEVLFYAIDPALKEQTSSYSIVQNLVLQIFDKSIGDSAFYKSACAALQVSIEGKPTAEVEDALWNALDVALSSTLSKFMIIVDGIDQLGEAPMLQLLARLHKITSKAELVKAIALSRPLTKAAPKNTKLWTVEAENTTRDIAHFAHERIASSPALKSLTHEQKHTLVEKISKSSNGSFAWADIAIEIIKTEKTLTSITKTLDSLPKTLKETINYLVATVNLSNKETKSIFAWMLAAQRPLLLTEIKQLFEIDLTNSTYSQRFTDIEADVHNACGGLVDATDGIIRFRSLAIRHHLIDLSVGVKDFSNSPKNAFPFHLQEASYDICLRSILFVKLMLDRQFHVSTVLLSHEQLIELFNEHTFLEYACRYWLHHFQNSPMHQYPGEHKLTSGFKSSFPTTVAHSLVEGTCLMAQYSPTEVYDLLQLSLTLRKTVLGENSEPVLQTMINAGTVRQHLTIKGSNIHFYQAFKLSQILFSSDSETTITCAQRYIDSITTFTTKSTEIEEVLTYIISVKRKTVGVSSDNTLTYLRRLAEYYVVVKEESKAATIYREIYEVMVSRHGHHHTETEEIYRRLKTVSKVEEIEHITRERHTSVEKHVTVSDSKRVTSTRDMVAQYERENNIEKAEETMVNYWREISEVNRTSKDVKVQEQQVNVTFEYAKFLQRHKRTEEATTILNGLYLELEKNTTLTGSKITWIQQIGEQMKTMGSMSSARHVFSSLFTYYRNSGQQNTKEAQSVARSLTETATSSVTSTTTVESQEEIWKQILETTTMSSTTSVDITMVRTSQQLITLYVRQERHEEIIHVSRDILARLWPSLLTGQKDVKMPTEFLTESVDIANHLARSYFILHYVDESTQIYLSIFQGYRSNPKKYITELVNCGRQLVTHYQNIYHHKDAIYIIDALYEAMVEVYGSTSHQSIDILYEKADLELRHNRRREAQASYEKIYTILKDKSEYCHKQGIRAALALCKMYEKEQKWTQAREVYHILWLTFINKGKEYDLGVEFVNQIFDQYLFIVQNKTQSDYKTIRGLAAQYRETCIKFYGPDAEQTLTATMRLATLDEKDEQYKQEAITLYETIIDTSQSSKKISSATTFTTIATARRNLAHLYSSRNITTDRAQKLYLEEFESTKNKNGYSHKDTLFWLGLLITCYKRQSNAESSKAASSILQDVATHILINEKDTHKLYESSSELASLYEGITSPSPQEFLTELRRHVITGDSNIAALKGKTADRRSYTFIVGFEEAITGAQFSVLMSELMSESLLTEAYLKAKKSKAHFDSVFTYGCRLRLFLKKRNRSITRIDEELLEIFTHYIVGQRTVEKNAVKQFFEIVISQHGQDQQDVNVLRLTSEAILRALNENQFQRGYSLAVLVDSYMHHYEGFRSQSKIEMMFKVCLYLTGRDTKKCNDAKLNEQMLHLSRVLLKEVLQAAKSIHLHLIALPLVDLNALIALLGDQKNYEDLEWILHDLWNSRHAQSSWPPSTLVSIGRKLVECRFTMGNRASAIHLCEDIYYNLRRVWGPLDKTTLEISSLLAEMYTAIGEHSKAMGVHEEILNQIISDEIDMDQVSSSEEADIAVRHIDLLRRSYARNGAKFPADKSATSYADLYNTLKEAVGDQKSWQAGGAKLEGVDKWAASAKSWKGDASDGGLGNWHDVSNWEILSEGEKKRKHFNALRRISGRFGVDSYTNGSSMNGSTRSVSITSNGA